MILADTSVWVAHFRQGLKLFAPLLEELEVLRHPFVVGELACGRWKNRAEIMALLNTLPAATLVTHDEALELVTRARLGGAGVGWVDVHLLASALVDRVPLLTLDKPLAAAARALGALYEPT